MNLIDNISTWLVIFKHMINNVFRKKNICGILSITFILINIL